MRTVEKDDKSKLLSEIKCILITSFYAYNVNIKLKLMSFRTL